MVINNRVSLGDELYVHTVEMLVKEKMNKGIWYYSSIKEKWPEIVEKIFRIGGINSVILYNKSLQVSKDPSLLWDDIIPEIEKIIQNIRSP